MIEKISLIRGAFANEYELQNYAPLAKKFDIQVITSKHPLTPIPLPTLPLWSPSDLPRFPFRKQLLNRVIGGEQWLVGLDKVIKTGSIVHTAETYTPYTHQAVQMRKAGRISKLVCTCWETIPHNNEKLVKIWNWKQEAHHYIDLFHTPTERAKKALIFEGVDPKKIKVIPYGVDLFLFQPRKNNISHDRRHIITVARLQKEKGMEIIEKVAAHMPDYEFTVVGQGEYTPIGNNITVTAAPYSTLPTIYQSADIFFFPSQPTLTWEEQYGMALIEAMACGLPIVASDSGAIPEVVGDAGIVCKHNDINGFVKSMQLLEDSQQFKKYAHASLDRAKKIYDRDQVAKKLATLYL